MILVLMGVCGAGKTTIGAACQPPARVHAATAPAVAVRRTRGARGRARRRHPRADCGASALHSRCVRAGIAMTKYRKAATLVGQLGRAPRKWLGAVSTPVFRATTILFPTVEDLHLAMQGKHPGLTYGLHGLPTVSDFEAAMAELEGGYAALAVPSGLTATTLPLLALAQPGNHVLVTDAVYGPTRRFCELHLRRLGVDVSYYDPLIGADIAREFRPNTKLVFL